VVTVVVAPEGGVVVTEPRLDPGAALLTLTVTLVVGVVVVAVVVATPAPVTRVVFVLPSETLTEPSA
jgi:hypothetical protein